jgi:hypothetical protein
MESLEIYCNVQIVEREQTDRHLPFPQASLDLVNISYWKEHRRRTEIACISLLSTESPS